jgi:two-component system response regulator HydG
VKGAFTDALTDRVGKFEYANGGTLFLDEIGDMPLDTQVKLLRVLEEREVTRVGDNKPFPVNVRVLSATHRNLEKETEAGTFRSDLYFRLKVVAVDIPPLAARRDDVIPLMDHFRRMFAKRHKKTITRVQPEVTRKFHAYDWPGNVRELRNAMETMIVLDNDGILDVDDLPPELIDQDTDTPGSEHEPVLGGPTELIGQSMSMIERWAIEHTLQLTGGNREEAAKILEIGSRTLYRKLKDYSEPGGNDQ